MCVAILRRSSSDLVPWGGSRLLVVCVSGETRRRSQGMTNMSILDAHANDRCCAQLKHVMGT